MNKDIKVIVSHANCADGVASVMFAHHAFPESEIKMVNYGPERDELSAVPGMLFIDMTPPESRVQEFIDAGAYVLDHHASAKDLVAKFGDRGIFADEKTEPGVSGALLAYRHVYTVSRGYSFDESVSVDCMAPGRFARLVGIRDTWQKGSLDWEEACAVSSALLFFPLEHFLSYDVPCISYADVSVGRVIVEKRKEDVVKAAKNILKYKMRNGGTLGVVLLARPDLISDLSEYCRQQEGINVLACFWYFLDKKNVSARVSLRSDGSVDVASIAKRLGGGGHTKAAGFNVTQSSLRGVPDVLELLRLLSRRD